MLDRPRWAPKRIDLTRPSGARVYDYLLGGGCNTAADRELAKQLLEVMPQVRDTVRLNRNFLRRVVTYLVGQGVTQFLDIGSGIPSVGNVHQLAQGLDPKCRVAYVDNDPIAIAYAEPLLRDNDLATAVLADFRSPEQVLGAPAVRSLIDFDQPVAVLTLLMMHFVPDSADPARLMGRYRDALVSGSYVALSHPSFTGAEGELLADAQAVGEIVQNTMEPLHVRTADDLLRIIAGFEPVPPGVVHLPLWRPDSAADVGCHPESSLVYGVVAAKP
ncbi:SAM-dependent methyltransferase [Kutzneria kofuensis]|nr:SAM-dependent methyltransferase [Kutzneria kofuensis]